MAYKSDTRVGKKRSLTSWSLVAVYLIMLILLGAMWASIVNQVTGNPVPSEEATENEVTTYHFPLVTRAEWNARPPKEVNKLATPVPYVVIHHSYIPPACHTDTECCKAMRSMQNFHMDDRGWCDIGYHFAVGSNGKAYEGRGWKAIGAQALHFNTVSIGICVIGDWRYDLPPAEQLKTTQKLIEAGVALGFIRKDYKLVGHRQVRATECPGDALFNEIKNWTHFSPFPNSVDDLELVEELPTAVKKLLKKERTILQKPSTTQTIKVN